MNYINLRHYAVDRYYTHVHAGIHNQIRTLYAAVIEIQINFHMLSK